MEFTQEQLCAANAAAWAYYTNLQLDGHPYELKKRTYQQELLSFYTMDGKTKYFEVIQTGSQVGKTIGKVIEATHGAIYNKYPQGIIFYFPQRKGVDIFSAGRFQYFIDENPHVKEQMGSSNVNRNDCRRIGKTNIYFFGAGASVRVGGQEKDSSSARSTPADWIILDERAIFDETMAKQLNQRLGNSKIARRTDVGTPKIPGDGLDTVYQASDQRQWHIKCDSCGEYTCAEDQFIEDAEKAIQTVDGIGHLVCKKCGKWIVPYAPGSCWVPKYPDRDVVGYWVSQMLNPNRNLDLLLRQWRDPEGYQWSIEEFYRTVLGLPYISAEHKLTIHDVYSCTDQYIQHSTCSVRTAMGVDVGKVLHYVIGIKIGPKQYEILKVGRAKDWYELHDIASRMNVKFAVIDHDPEIHAAEEFRKNESYAVFLNRYSDTMEGPVVWTTTGNNKGCVKCNRTKWCDKTHDVISDRQLIIPIRCSEIDQYAFEMTNTVKVLETDEKSGLTKFRYRQLANKPDHYFHATLYFLLAASQTAETRREEHKNKLKQPINNFYL